MGLKQWWMNRGHYHICIHCSLFWVKPENSPNPNYTGPILGRFPLHQSHLKCGWRFGRFGRLPRLFRAHESFRTSSSRDLLWTHKWPLKGLSHLHLGNQSRSLWITWLVLIVPIWARWFHQSHAVSHKTPSGIEPCTPLKTNMHCKTSISNRNYIFKWWIFHCHVSFRGGNESWNFSVFGLKHPSILPKVNRQVGLRGELNYWGERKKSELLLGGSSHLVNG